MESNCSICSKKIYFPTIKWHTSHCNRIINNKKFDIIINGCEVSKHFCEDCYNDYVIECNSCNKYIGSLNDVGSIYEITFCEDYFLHHRESGLYSDTHMTDCYLCKKCYDKYMNEQKDMINYKIKKYCLERFSQENKNYSENKDYEKVINKIKEIKINKMLLNNIGFDKQTIKSNIKKINEQCHDHHLEWGYDENNIILKIKDCEFSNTELNDFDKVRLEMAKKYYLE